MKLNLEFEKEIPDNVVVVSLVNKKAIRRNRSLVEHKWKVDFHLDSDNQKMFAKFVEENYRYVNIDSTKRTVYLMFLALYNNLIEMGFFDSLSNNITIECKERNKGNYIITRDQYSLKEKKRDIPMANFYFMPIKYVMEQITLNVKKKPLKCDDISRVFDMQNDYEIYLAYKCDGSKEESVDVLVSPRRKYSVEYTKESPIDLIVYNYKKGLYVTERLIPNEKNIINIIPVLDRLGVDRKPAKYEEWSMWKSCRKGRTEVSLFDTGYYTFDYFWSDCNFWRIKLHFCKGIRVGKKEIIGFSCEKLYEPIGNEVFRLIFKMLMNNNCTEELYSLAKAAMKKDSCKVIYEYYA